MHWLLPNVNIANGCLSFAVHASAPKWLASSIGHIRTDAVSQVANRSPNVRPRAKPAVLEPTTEACGRNCWRTLPPCSAKPGRCPAVHVPSHLGQRGHGTPVEGRGIQCNFGRFLTRSSETTSDGSENNVEMFATSRALRHAEQSPVEQPPARCRLTLNDLARFLCTPCLVPVTWRRV